MVGKNEDFESWRGRSKADLGQHGDNAAQVNPHRHARLAPVGRRLPCGRKNTGISTKGHRRTYSGLRPARRLYRLYYHLPGIGLAAALRFILYEILAMVSQQFPEFSVRMRLGFWLASVALFYLGVFFCLSITLPYGSRFLLDFETDRIKAVISVRKFIDFCLVFTYGFGLIFELPVVMLLLGKLGLVTVGKMAGFRRYAILVITIVSAMLTPTPDIFNLALMAVPLYLLFEVGIICMRIAEV